MQNLIIRITQENTSLISAPQIGCFILPESLSPKFIQEFIIKAQNTDKLVLMEGKNALDSYLKYKPDGMIINTIEQENPAKIIKEIQKKAKGAITGVICRNRRHEAMLISECEPDFIIFKVWQDGFDHNAELINWYSDFFLIQCAAQIEDDIDFSKLKSDFVILSDTQFSALK